MDSKRHSIKTVIEHTKKRHHHHEHRRTKKISQKIELKKQHFQCVINLNTTICERKAHQSEPDKKTCKCDSHQDKCESHKVSSINRERGHISMKSECNSRMAPYCFRDKCRVVVKQCRCREIKKRREHVRDKMAKHHHHKGRKQQETQDSGWTSRHRHRKNKNDSLQLSPISSSPLKDDLNHLYEEISNDSLDEVLETPLSYKNILHVENKVESKLDTLIRRTKERERKQVAQSRSRPRYSFSSISNMSSGECPMDLGTLDTVSLHSRSTLVLENSQSEFIYLSSDTENCQEYSRSPNIPKKYEYGQLYSPGSQPKNDVIFNIPTKYEHGQLYFSGSPQKNDFNVPRKYEHGQLNSSGSPSKNDFNVPRKYEHGQLYLSGSPSRNDVNVSRKYEHSQPYSPGSPSKNNFNVSRKYEHRHIYSPGSPSKNDFILNVSRKYEHGQLYSPGSPPKNDFNVPRKYELGQLYSPGSPSKNDFNVSRKYEHRQIYSPGSPSKIDFILNVPRKYEHGQLYSPGSPPKNDFIFNGPRKYELDRYSPDFTMNVPKEYENDFKIDNIKSEPMDVITYSPTDYSKVEIKKEIKS